MTKQEEIREGIASYIRLYNGTSTTASEFTSKAILEYLHSQGVVLKVDKELPINPYRFNVHLDAGIYDGLYREKYFEAQQGMVNAGFTAVEPLIEAEVGAK